jgi:hypothetical protein
MSWVRGPPPKQSNSGIRPAIEEGGGFVQRWAFPQAVPSLHTVVETRLEIYVTHPPMRYVR